MWKSPNLDFFSSSTQIRGQKYAWYHTAQDLDTALEYHNAVLTRDMTAVFYRYVAVWVVVFGMWFVMLVRPETLWIIWKGL